MIDKQKLLEELRDSTQQFVEALQKVQENSFADKPNEKTWSVAEVAEHVNIVEALSIPLMLGEVQITEGRAIDAKIELIKSGFLDFERKYSAWGPIIPRGEITNKKQLIEQFEAIRQKMNDIIEKEDLSLTVSGFAHPLFGTMTRLEWVYFNMIHSERHIQQVERLSS